MSKMVEELMSHPLAVQWFNEPVVGVEVCVCLDTDYWQQIVIFPSYSLAF
jgi:hypothetical protein